jgi:UDP-N-acetylglucosamine acyltransferase
VDKSAEIDPTASVGAYAIIEAGVKIGAGTRVFAHAYISEGVTIGERCQIHPFAVVGHYPQDIKWDGAPSYTVIGDDTVIREGAQVHRGTEPDSTTRIGSRVYMMANSHVAHNCTIGDDVIIANGALLSGHIKVGPKAFISGNVVIQQFARIGELAMLGGGIRVPNDVPPFMMVVPEGVVGVNLIGLRRAGMSREERQELRNAYKTLYRTERPFKDAVAEVVGSLRTEPGRRLADFLKAPSNRGIMRYRGRADAPESGE